MCKSQGRVRYRELVYTSIHFSGENFSMLSLANISPNYSKFTMIRLFLYPPRYETPGQVYLRLRKISISSRRN